MTERHHHDHCRKCNVAREGHLDLVSGRYDISLPSKCSAKHDCEQEIIRTLIGGAPQSSRTVMIEDDFAPMPENVRPLYKHGGPWTRPKGRKG